MVFLFPFVFPLCVDSFDERLHAAGAFLLHFFSDMAVHIQGKGCCGVAQVLLYRLDIVTRLDTGHGVGVPQIVEPGFWATDLLHDLLEGFIHGGGGQVLS